MIKYLIYLFIIVIVAFFVRNKIKVDFKSFLHKGFTPNRGIFGIYCYCGKQGTGKTYSVVEFLRKHKKYKIYANLTSIKNINYTYIHGFKELLKLRKEHDCIIFYDEIFTELTKNDRINKDVLDFLCQMRKRRILFLTTAQEWGEIPLTFRRYCRFQVNCSLLRLPLIGGLSIKKVRDAENLKWSSDDNDWVAPLIGTKVSHTQIRIANSYDTYEQIGYNAKIINTEFSLENSEKGGVGS